MEYINYVNWMFNYDFDNSGKSLKKRIKKIKRRIVDKTRDVLLSITSCGILTP